MPKLSHYVASLLVLLALAAPDARASSGNPPEPCVTMTGASMHLIVRADSLHGVEPGQAIRALVGGTCFGEGTFEGDDLSVTVWGAGPPLNGGEAEGPTQGDPVALFVAESGMPLVGAFEEIVSDAVGSLSYLEDGVYLSHRLRVFASQIGFATAGATVQQGEQAEVAVRLTHSDELGLAGFQFDLISDGPVLASVQAGPAVSGSGWSFSVADIDGGKRVVAINLSGSLGDGTHDLANVVLSGVAPGAVEIQHAIGTLADPVGTDAALGIGQGTFTLAIAPRGDVTGNGVTDLADFVATIDIVLGAADYNDAADLFPFPDGDGLVDVRDLNVLGRAILEGTWPDGQPVIPGALRDVVQRTGRGEKHERSEEKGDPITLFLTPHTEGYYLSTDQPLRAMQGTAETAGDVVAMEGATVLTHQDGPLLRFLVYTLSTDPLPAPFASGPVDLSPETLSELVGVTLEGESVPLTVAFATADEGVPDGDQPFAIYPNPASQHLRFTHPATGSAYDLLGRRVAEFEEVNRLDLRGLPTGPYFLKTADGTYRFTIIR